MMKVERKRNFTCGPYTFPLIIAVATLILLFSLQYDPRPNHIQPRFNHEGPADLSLRIKVQDFKFDRNYVEKKLATLDQMDPQLIYFARTRYLTPPSQQEYNLQGETGYKNEYTKWVRQIFGGRRNGTFIEIGANEGAKSSHTLELEMDLGWSGLLVECNPTVSPILKSRHRKAWVGSVCLSPASTPGMLNFSTPTNWTYSGTLGKPWIKDRKWEYFEVETIPLYTLLAAIGLNEIDYFLFDIEGQELAVLKSFPFDKVIFKVLIVEIYFYSVQERLELKMLLTLNGYHFVRNWNIDEVYVHNSVRHLLNP